MSSKLLILVLFFAHFHCFSMTFPEALQEVNNELNQLTREEKINLIKEDPIYSFALASFGRLTGKKNVFDYCEYFFPNMDIAKLSLLQQNQDWKMLPLDSLESIFASDKFPLQIPELSLDLKRKDRLRKRGFAKEAAELYEQRANSPYKTSCGAICLAMADWTLNGPTMDWREKVLQYPYWEFYHIN